MRGWLAAVLVLITLVPLSLADPTCSLVGVVDQYGRPIPGLEVRAVGGSVERVNSTHFRVCGRGGQFAFEASLYNVTVYQGVHEYGRDYLARAAVVDMVIKAPRDVRVTVCLAGSGKCWELLGKDEYVIRQVPVGTYRVVARGVTTLEETVYYTGGTLEITSTVRITPSLLPLLLAPVVIYGGYKAVRSRREIGARLPRPRLVKPKFEGLRKPKKRAEKPRKSPRKPKGGSGGRRVRRKQRTLAEILAELP